MKAQLRVEDTILTATLVEGHATQDFISLLPLTLILEDYAGTEKISNLPKRLSVADAPSGSKAQAGDITYYAPWGNLAIFYRDFRYAEGLVVLGRIEGDIEVLRSTGMLNVTIELVSES